MKKMTNLERLGEWSHFNHYVMTHLHVSEDTKVNDDTILTRICNNLKLTVNICIVSYSIIFKYSIPNQFGYEPVLVYM